MTLLFAAVAAIAAAAAEADIVKVDKSTYRN